MSGLARYPILIPIKTACGSTLLLGRMQVFILIANKVFS